MIVVMQHQLDTWTWIEVMSDGTFAYIQNSREPPHRVVLPLAHAAYEALMTAHHRSAVLVALSGINAHLRRIADTNDDGLGGTGLGSLG
jgi:hypothetical protein